MTSAPLTVAGVRGAIPDARPGAWWSALQDVLDLCDQWERDAAADDAAAASSADSATRAMLQAAAFDRRVNAQAVLQQIQGSLN